MTAEEKLIGRVLHFEDGEITWEDHKMLVERFANLDDLFKWIVATRTSVGEWFVGLEFYIAYGRWAIKAGKLDTTTLAIYK